MRTKALPATILVVALTALVASVGWATTRDRAEGWTMMRYGNAGMMGYQQGGQTIVNLAEAKQQAQRFARRLDLRVGEVMRFANHYYAELREQDGRPATEVLVDPATGNVYLEYGPAMMWNTRYGMMSDFRLRGSDGMMGGGMMGSPEGMMGGGTGGPTGTTGEVASDVSSTEAAALATRWVRGRGVDLTAGEPDAFPGYYTLHVLRNSRVVGMLSVNAATGAVWSHWWHGRFIAMLEP